LTTDPLWILTSTALDNADVSGPLQNCYPAPIQCKGQPGLRRCGPAIVLARGSTPPDGTIGTTPQHRVTRVLANRSLPHRLQLGSRTTALPPRVAPKRAPARRSAPGLGPIHIVGPLTLGSSYDFAHRTSRSQHRTSGTLSSCRRTGFRRKVRLWTFLGAGLVG
jgi:hypothetical protein